MPTIFTFKRSLEYFTLPLKEDFVFVYLALLQMLLDATKLFNFNLSVSYSLFLETDGKKQ